MKNNRRNLIILISCSLAIILILFFVSIKIHEIKSNTCTIAFYDVPEKISSSIQSILTPSEKEKSKNIIKFVQLDSTLPLDYSAVKKYNILITWDGKATNDLASAALELPVKLFTYVPTTVTFNCMYDGKRFELPLLLDHQEIAYYKRIKNENELATPETFEDFSSYLVTVKDKVDYPLIVPGKDDKELLGFISGVAAAMYDASTYEKFLKEIADNCVSTDSTNTANAAEYGDFSRSTLKVLDAIKDMQSQKLLAQSWYNCDTKDVQLCMKEHMIAAASMTLTTHRTLPNLYIKYFESTCVPFSSTNKRPAVVSPFVAAVLLNENNLTPEVLTSLIDTVNQSLLSDSTLLAPVNARTEPHDRQADNVRFWAASIPNGPVASIYYGSFSDPAMRTSFCKKVREYLEK